jgi:hypothetical protein
MGGLSVSGGLNASVDRDQLASALRVTGHISESVPRQQIGANVTGTLASGSLQLQALYIPGGRTITNVLWLTGDTALGTPTAWWFALYNSSRVLLSQTADQTSTAWGSNTLKELALATPQVTTAGGLYYAGVLCVGGTMPSFVGLAHRGTGVIGLAPITFGRSTTGLTTTAPDPAGAITAQAATVWCAVS